MEREIIKTSRDVVSCSGQVVIDGEGLVIRRMMIDVPADAFKSDYSLRDQPLVDLRGVDCTVGEIYIMGNVSLGMNREQWKTRVMSGLRISGDGNLVGRVFAQSVHIPLLVTGEGNKVVELEAHHFSGDGFNLCNNHNEILKADFVGGLDVFPYVMYHTDVGMMYHKSGGVLEGCNVCNVTYKDVKHRWAGVRQGILTDGLTVDCNVYNFTARDIHEEHGVSYADAFGCEVVNLRTNGRLNWQKKAPEGCRVRGNRLVGVSS